MKICVELVMTKVERVMTKIFRWKKCGNSNDKSGNAKVKCNRSFIPLSSSTVQSPQKKAKHHHRLKYNSQLKTTWL